MGGAAVVVQLDPFLVFFDPGRVGEHFVDHEVRHRRGRRERHVAFEIAAAFVEGGPPVAAIDRERAHHQGSSGATFSHRSPRFMGGDRPEDRLFWRAQHDPIVLDRDAARTEPNLGRVTDERFGATGSARARAARVRAARFRPHRARSTAGSRPGSPAARGAPSRENQLKHDGAGTLVPVPRASRPALPAGASVTSRSTTGSANGAHQYGPGREHGGRGIRPHARENGRRVGRGNRERQGECRLTHTDRVQRGRARGPSAAR